MQQIIWPIAVAFVVALAVGPITLPLLKRLKVGQNVRDDGPKSHLTKAGTPTMGGMMILVGVIVASFLFTRSSFEWTLFAVLTTLGYAAIGFLDDYIKVVKHRSLGLRPYQKIIGQFGLAIIIALYAYTHSEIGTTLYVPILDIEWDLGIFYIPFTIFVVIGTVNSVNLTDGLDGLAASVSIIVCAAFAIIAYGMSETAAAAGETLRAIELKNMAVFGSAAAGACLGFLRYNSFPAKVFMGDTGSLALGGMVSILAITTRMQLLLPIIGGMFMMSSISCIIQVLSCKLRNKRVFKMAPLHHHFELKGMHETKVVAMYILITLALSLVAFLLLSL